MAFTEIVSSWIEVGKALKAELFTSIKDSLDDLNTRAIALENTQGQIVIFDGIVRNAASLESGGTITGLTTYRASQDFSLSDCKITIFEKGSLTGNLEIDIRKSSSLDDTLAGSVFTTKPKIVYSTASDYDESTNAVFNDSNDDILEGDYLFLDVSELPSGGTIGKFAIYLTGEA